MYLFLNIKMTFLIFFNDNNNNNNLGVLILIST